MTMSCARFMLAIASFCECDARMPSTNSSVRPSNVSNCASSCCCGAVPPTTSTCEMRCDRSVRAQANAARRLFEPPHTSHRAADVTTGTRRALTLRDSAAHSSEQTRAKPPRIAASARSRFAAAMPCLLARVSPAASSSARARRIAAGVS